MTRRAWPRLRSWFALGCITCITVLVGMLPVFGWGPAQWHEFTSASREASLLVTVVTAGFCAHIPRALTSTGVVAGRPAVAANRVVNWQLSRIVMAVGLGTLVAELVAGAYVASHADGGAPDLLSAAGVIAGNIAVGLAAYAISVCLAVRAGGLIAAIITVLGVVLLPGLNPVFGNSGISTRQPALIWLNDFPLIGWEVTAQTALTRLVLFGIIGAASWLVALVRVRWPLGPRISASSFLAATAAMVCLSIAQSPPLVERDVVAAVCKETDGIEVCLHPDYVSLTEPVSQAADATLEMVPESRRPMLVQQTGTRADLAEDAVSIQLDHLSSEGELESAVAVPLSEWASGAAACQELRDEVAGELIPEQIERVNAVQHALALTIQERAGVQIYTGMADAATGEPVRPPELEALSVLDDDELRAWMNEHAEAIGDCAVNPESIP